MIFFENLNNSKIKDSIMPSKCPKCGSNETTMSKYMGVDTLLCNVCGFDESLIYEIVPDQKTSQKAKGQYSVYKAGGHQRSKK